MLRLLTLAIFLLALPTPARADDISTAGRSVVRVVVFTVEDGEVVGFGHGSGFAIAPNRIVTNAHVTAAPFSPWPLDGSPAQARPRPILGRLPGALRLGRQTLVLLPEIALTESFWSAPPRGSAATRCLGTWASGSRRAAAPGVRSRRHAARHQRLSLPEPDAGRRGRRGFGLAGGDLRAAGRTKGRDRLQGLLQQSEISDFAEQDPEPPSSRPAGARPYRPFAPLNPMVIGVAVVSSTISKGPREKLRGRRVGEINGADPDCR